MILSFHSRVQSQPRRPEKTSSAHPFNVLDTDERLDAYLVKQLAQESRRLESARGAGRLVDVLEIMLAEARLRAARTV